MSISELDRAEIIYNLKNTKLLSATFGLTAGTAGYLSLDASFVQASVIAVAGCVGTTVGKTLDTLIFGAPFKMPDFLRPIAIASVGAAVGAVGAYMLTASEISEAETQTPLQPAVIEQSSVAPVDPLAGWTPFVAAP